MKKVFAEIHAFLQSCAAKLGFVNDKVVAALPGIATFFGKLISFQDNPAIEAIEDAIIGAKFEQIITNALHWAFTQFSIGTQIEKDVAAATTLSEKIKAVLTDILNNEPTVRKMKIGDIAALVVKYLGGTGVSVNLATQLIEAEIAKMNEEQTNAQSEAAQTGAETSTESAQPASNTAPQTEGESAALDGAQADAENK